MDYLSTQPISSSLIYSSLLPYSSRLGYSIISSVTLSSHNSSNRLLSGLCLCSCSFKEMCRLLRICLSLMSKICLLSRLLINSVFLPLLYCTFWYLYSVLLLSYCSKITTKSYQNTWYKTSTLIWSESLIFVSFLDTKTSQWDSSMLFLTKTTFLNFHFC